jgi:hypothetical protein
MNEGTRTAPPWGGTVAPGYEAVLEGFLDGIDDLGDGGGAFAAYVDGRPVADLWGGHAHQDQPWQRETLTTIFSTTKALSTLCLQILFDRDRLDLDARIADLWPEFGTAGKERIRIRHVLSHTSGILAPVDPAAILSWQGYGWNDHERLADHLAAAVPAVTVGATFAYHAFTFGWVVAKSSDGSPASRSGRSSGVKLPSRSIWISGSGRRGPSSHESPKSSQSRLDNWTQIRRPSSRAQSIARDPSSLTGQAFLAMPDGYLLDHLAVVNLPAFQEAEIPALNGTGTARSIARLFAVLPKEVSSTTFDWYRSPPFAGSALSRSMRRTHSN